MKQVVKYQTDDGQLFDTKAAAASHENRSESVSRLTQIVSQSGLSSTYVTNTEIAMWIYDNRNFILDCLKND